MTASRNAHIAAEMDAFEAEREQDRIDEAAREARSIRNAHIVSEMAAFEAEQN